MGIHGRKPGRRMLSGDSRHGGFLLWAAGQIRTCSMEKGRNMNSLMLPMHG